MTKLSHSAVAIGVFCLILMSGCYGKRIYEIETRLYRNERDLSQVQDSLADVSGTVAHLDTTVGSESAPMRASAADAGSRMDELLTRIEILEELVKENRYRIGQVSLMSVAMPQGRDSLSAAQGDTTMAQASVATHIYETAYLDFTRGDFEPAIDGFRDFVRLFPRTEFSDDAQFMIAQAFFTQGDFPNAIIEFRKVLDHYPSGDKVPEAMYKLGLSYLEIDDTATAREYFKILVSRYPGSPESKRAQEMLEDLPARGD
jgi:tol-pal system protein YbgF